MFNVRRWPDVLAFIAVSVNNQVLFSIMHTNDFFLFFSKKSVDNEVCNLGLLLCSFIKEPKLCSFVHVNLTCRLILEKITISSVMFFFI